MTEIIIMQLVGLLLIAVSLPLIFGKIKPNRWYGFRTPSTLSDEKIWYAANKKTSIDMSILGGLIIFSSLLMEDERLFIYFPFLLILGVLIMMIRGFYLIHKMKQNKKQ